MEENTELFPELADILNRIKSFNIAHPEGRFIYAFLGFKKDPEHKCGAFGYIDEVRALINNLRDNIEDNREISKNGDEPDFVNF